MAMQIPAAKICFPEEDRQLLLNQIGGILESGQLTLGKYTKEFEEKFAAYVGTKFAIAVNSGTSALEIVLRALDIEGFSVVVPTNTFFATAAAVIHAGGKVVFADNSENLCLDTESLKKAITNNVKAVILVHIGGAVAPQTNEILKICNERNLYLIEDAAHAHGSTYNGKPAGSFGIAGSFSFYPTKVMTSGEGGMITTNNEVIYNRALVFRDQGKAGFLGNIHTEMGNNWRMSEIHAAIGLSQFNRLDEFISDRRRAAKIYDERLKGTLGLKILKIPNEVKSNYYKYIAVLDNNIDRTQFKKKVKENYGIGLSGEVYELPLHLQPIFKKIYGSKEGQFPVAEDLCKRHICLPVFARMSEEQANYVADSLKEAIK